MIELEITKQGQKSVKKFAVAEGQKRIWTAANNLVESEKVMKLAKGEAVTKEELTQCPHLGELVDPVTLKDNGKAKALLTDAAQRGAAFLIEVDAKK